MIAFARYVAALVVCGSLLVGCGDDAPSCKEMVAALDKNLAKTGLDVPVTQRECQDHKYSATLRRCLSAARSATGLERCVSIETQRCLKGARNQSDIDHCTAARDVLGGFVGDSLAGQRLDRDKTLRTIADWDLAFDHWTEKHPAKECPASLDELAAFAREIESPRLELPTTDRWGSAFTLECTADDAWVISMGPDKQRGTADDLDSSQVDSLSHRPRKKLAL